MMHGVNLHRVIHKSWHPICPKPSLVSFKPNSIISSHISGDIARDCTIQGSGRNEGIMY